MLRDLNAKIFKRFKIIIIINLCDPTFMICNTPLINAELSNQIVVVDFLLSVKDIQIDLKNK